MLARRAGATSIADGVGGGQPRNRGHRRRGRVLVYLSLVLSMSTLASSARADDAPGTGPLRWDPAWSHAGAADYSLASFGITDSLLYELFVQPKQPPLRWTSPILFDKAVRDALRGSSLETRNMAGNVSWGLLGAVLVYPLVDVPYAWKRYDSQLAWDLFWQDATALSLGTAFDLNLRDLVGRARPPVYACLSSGGSEKECLGSSSESTRSFPGGHQLMVTTAAALTCTQHLSMHLYGGPWDAIACATALTAATSVGVLRIVADDHWASDILVGSALGVAFGWGIPTAMHLHGHAPMSGSSGIQLVPTAMPVHRGGGLGVTGLF
jgi:membrane-associated phospholipid phosphatase